MPLSFRSLSHGTIAFGFFNIETDLLLLERLFFFATEFCDGVISLAQGKDSAPWQAFRFLETEAIGDLHGAIEGTVHTGFIGSVYKQYPFPLDPNHFKQQPEGNENQDRIKALIAPFTQKGPIRLQALAEDSLIRIDDYAFSRADFQALILYVWAGGYPRWRDQLRPSYVQAMKEAVQQSSRVLFRGLEFPEPTAP